MFVDFFQDVGNRKYTPDLGEDIVLIRQVSAKVSLEANYF